MTRFIILFSILGLLGCQQKNAKEESVKKQPEDFTAKADSLAHAYIIVDTHVDFPYRLKHIHFNPDTDSDLVMSSEEGNFDFRRASRGGLDAPFMSIYIPSSYQKMGGAKQLADSLIDMVHSIVDYHPGMFALANTPADVLKNFQDGKISLPMGMENGAPIESDLKNISYFHDRGIRYITLTHAKDNEICDSSYDSTRTWNGLSDFGVEVVKEMNRVGIMVDISHVSDSTFYQVMQLTDVPVIASHSSCRYFTPGFERNMSDDMIKLLGKKNGVIQITFGTTFLDEHSRQVGDELGKVMKEKGISRRDSSGKAFVDNYLKENNFWTDVSKVADHIDHAVELAGIDHVGLGSDFDGVGDELPVGLKDVSMYPNIIKELLKRGYTDDDIAKICYKNIFRVWQAVEDAAEQPVKE